MGAFELTVAYGPTVVEILSASLGEFPESTGRTVVTIAPGINSTVGTVAFAAYSMGSTPEGPSGDGVLAVLSLRALAEGESGLTFTEAQVADRTGSPQSIGEPVNGRIRVVQPTSSVLALPLIVREAAAQAPTPTPSLTPDPQIDALDGLGNLYSYDGKTFLGLVSSNCNAHDSIVNASGPYGSQASDTSITNPQGPYGSPDSPTSAFNHQAPKPPIIWTWGSDTWNFVAFVSTNSAKAPRIDPNRLLSYLRAKGSCL